MDFRIDNVVTSGMMTEIPVELEVNTVESHIESSGQAMIESSGQAMIEQDEKIDPDSTSLAIIDMAEIQANEPCVAQEFESEAGTHGFYNAYATKVGFASQAMGESSRQAMIEQDSETHNERDENASQAMLEQDEKIDPDSTSLANTYTVQVHACVDLREELLATLPATSLRRLKLACKLWELTYERRDFKLKHLERAKRKNSFMMIWGMKLCSMELNMQEVEKKLLVDEATDVSHSISWIDNPFLNNIYIGSLYHCDGLLLCKPVGCRHLRLWNPCTNESKVIKYPKSNGRCEYFALGRNKDSFKILMFYKHPDVSEQYAIIDCCSNRWKKVTRHGTTYGIHRSNAITLMGNVYWVATTRGSEQYVLIFDFETETYRRLNLPLGVFPLDELQLSTNDDRLMICMQHSAGADSYIKEIWVSSRILKDNQTKSLRWEVFNIRSPYKCAMPIFIDKDMKFEVSCIFKSKSEGQFVVSGKDGQCLEIPFKDDYLFRHKDQPSISHSSIVTFFPSLLQIEGIRRVAKA